jgi:putative membrane protein
MYIIFRWIASAIALYLTVMLGDWLHLGLYIEPGTAAIIPALVAVAVLAAVNVLIRPIVQLLTLPLTCLTLGLFSFVINAVMFWLAGQFVSGFHVKGFEAALFGSISMSILGGLINSLLIATVSSEVEDD